MTHQRKTVITTNLKDSMNTADNVHAAMQAEKAKKAKKALLSVAAACLAKKAPTGAPVLKKPKPAVLKIRPETYVPLVHGSSELYWMVYFLPKAGSHNLPCITFPNRYHTTRSDARRWADALNRQTREDGSGGYGAYRVARVTVSVKYTP